MRELLKTVVVWTLGLALGLGLVSTSMATGKPKRPTIIHGCTQEDLGKPGAVECLNKGLLEGVDVYVVCAADGSQQCCWKAEGGGEACVDIVGRPASPPAVAPRAPTPPRTAP